MQRCSQITMFSVSRRSSLKDLDGISMFSNTIELHHMHNNVNDMTPLAVTNDTIETIDTSHNNVHDVMDVESLGVRTNLHSLNLRCNPIEK